MTTVGNRSINREGADPSSIDRIPAGDGSAAACDHLWVRDGIDRMDVGYIWPTYSRPAAIVRRSWCYLDLNHWISLAKVNSGRTNATHRDVLDACLQASASQRAIFPIADTMYVEMAKIGRYRQRRDIREIIERLGGFAVVTSRRHLTHEIEALLDNLGRPNPTPIRPPCRT